MKKRPRCEFVNVGLNVNKMVKIAHETLLKADMEQEAQQFMDEINQATRIGQIFGIIARYVDTTSDLYEYLEERERERTLRRIK